MRANLACLLLLAGCASAPPEAPVREGLNDNFLSPELDVEEFVQRFEGESREIARWRRSIADAVEIEPGMAVADIGSGTGLFVPLFDERVGDDGHVYLVELSPKFIEHLDARIRAEGRGNVSTVLCDERSSRLPPGSVDRVFICDTYHHFTYPLTTLASLYQALRPGGELVLVDFERIEGVTREWVMNHVRADKETFRSEVESAGFEFVEEVDLQGLEENYFLRFRRN